MSTATENSSAAPPTKSSMEILSELFSTFDAEPPLIIKKEKEDINKKQKKAKKKHKHKEKKHKKKTKKRKRSSSSSSDRSNDDVSGLRVKREKVKEEKADANVKPKIKKEKVEGDAKHKTNDTTTSTQHKISIKNLKFTSLFEATIEEIKKKHENDSDKSEGELSDKAKSKHKHSRHHHHKHKDSSKSSQRSSKKENERQKREREKDVANKSREKDKYRDDDYYKKSRTRKEQDSRSRDVSGKRDLFYKEDRSRIDRFREGSHEERKSDSWHRHTDYGVKDPKPSRKPRVDDIRYNDSQIDKKKLLEIARRNAIQMMKSGSLPAALTLGPHAQEKVLAAIRSGGKTVEELTDFCKTLSQKEELGELSSASGEEDEEDNVERVFHHPFQISARPTSIVMNIKNSVPLPTKTSQERNTELRLQFPVSSGSSHRKTENDWVPVAAKPTETVQAVVMKAPVADAAKKPDPTPTVFTNGDASVDIGSIVSQRLTALRKLQENPYDVQALTQVHRSQKEMQNWAESKQQPGQFTGSTGAQILSQAELSSGYQAWARRDQLQLAAPVSGGMGMHLLKKMGWNPGEGLGKEKSGTLEPLLLEIKLDKKGLVANEEQRHKSKVVKAAAKTLEDKHPVSLLGEFTAKRKLGPPQYTLCFESGPDHKKNFLFKVTVNGTEYKSDTASANKKLAKAEAAKICLQQMGLLM